MANVQKQREIPDGYREVRVPKGYLIVTNKSGKRVIAEEEDIVLLSNESLKRDPYLIQFCTDATDEEKADYFDDATTPSLQTALKKRDLDFEKLDRKDLIQLAREQGVGRFELEYQAKDGGTKPATVSPPPKK